MLTFSSGKVFYTVIIRENGGRGVSKRDGAYTEQFVAQQLTGAGVSLYYFSSADAKTELDFLSEIDGRAIPIEVKAGTNLQSKSLTHFVNKHHIERAVKFSQAPQRRNEIIFNEPLYLAEYLTRLVSD